MFQNERLYINNSFISERNAVHKKKRIRHKVSKKVKNSVIETTSQPIFFDNSEKKRDKQ